MSTIRWLGGLLVLLGSSAAGQTLQLSPVELSQALVVVGELQEITATLHNPSSATVEHLTVDLLTPFGWSADPVRLEIAAIGPFATHPIRFRLMPTRDSNGDGRIVVSGGTARPLESVFHLSSCHPLAPSMMLWRQTEPAVDRVDEDGCVYVATGSYILFLPRCGEGHGSGLVYLRRGRRWDRVATLPALGHLLYDDGGKTAERWVCPETAWIPPRDPRGEYLLTLRDEWTDESGREWVSKVFFAPTSDPRVIKCTHAVWCSAPALLYRFEGPMTCAGDGSFGAARGEVAMPAEAEQRHDQALLARGDADGPGVMAVESPRGGVIGVLYDPAQAWSRDRLGPHGLFASPNRLYRQQNHYLALMLPHFGVDQFSWARRASAAYRLTPGEPVFLRSELFVSPDGDVATARAAWSERFAPGGPGYLGNPLG